jgi:hypothetical protein
MKQWNVQAAVRTLQDRAAPHTPPWGHGRCAEYTRIAIEAGFGGAPVPHTEQAKDYGPILMDEGFLPLGRLPGGFLAGDVAVIEALPPRSPSGHMCMFDGDEWISDFRQLQGTDGLYPGPRYRILRPPYVIYRHPLPRAHGFESAVRDPFARPLRPIT